MNILVVCLGNICRSPMAEGILRTISEEEQLNWMIDSAGTSNWHIGEPPDQRAIETCYQHGIDISLQRSRQFETADFSNFDLILAMDDANFADIQSMTDDPRFRKKVKRIMDFVDKGSGKVIPDPYFDNRFNEVFELLVIACKAVLTEYQNPQMHDVH